MKRLAQFLHLLDTNDNLNLLDIAVMVALVKLALAPVNSFSDVGMVLTTLLAKLWQDGRGA